MDLLVRSCDVVFLRFVLFGSNGLMLGEIEILGLRVGEIGIELIFFCFLLFFGRSCGVCFVLYFELGFSCGFVVVEIVFDGFIIVGFSEGDGKGVRDGVLDGLVF